MPKGGCHCGSVRYEMPEQTVWRAICHCTDCRKQSGAPMVSWALVEKDQLKVEGETQEYASSENGRRQFCPKCGTGLFYTNDATLPGKVDVQTATLDDPDAMPPQIQVQSAERIGWMEKMHDLPAFKRYPGME
jgi:hypothetical protein